jgi:hypothetical protein
MHLFTVFKFTSTLLATQAQAHLHSGFAFKPSTVGLQRAQLVRSMLHVILCLLISELLDAKIDPLPLPFNFNTSNSEIAHASNSWWISSFVHGDNNHQYMILSHVLATGAYSIYRGSIYDITEPDFVQFTTTTTDSGLLDNSQNGGFNITTNDFFFGSSLPGNATEQLRTASTNSDVQFDITFDLSAPVIFNTGNGGLFQFGIDQTGEWSMPAGSTTGSLVHKGKTISIDTDHSFTWYDRQWNIGAPASLNWTWFQLHVSSHHLESPRLLSIWSYDSNDVGHRQWATTQSTPGVSNVMPVKTYEPFGPNWVSPNSNNTYSQSWEIVLQDNTRLTVKSTHEDQELRSDTFVTYEGFVTVTGVGPDGEPVSGYGLVEIQPPI